tara:strand:- start:2456 stop:3043 length:588 start_codon:yes stop_codon:yes gene_type:complete
MKKILLILTIGAFSMQAQAKKVEWKEYAIPCLVSIAAGALLVKEDGAGVGLTACLGLSTIKYYNDKKQEDFASLEVFQAKLEEHNKLMEQKRLEISEEMKKLKETQDKEIIALREVMKDVLVEKLMEVDDTVQKRIKTQLSNKAVIQSLEDKAMSRIKSEVNNKTESMKKDIVKECVNETINQVTAKPIGVSTSE